jgi:hypothetical protein
MHSFGADKRTMLVYLLCYSGLNHVFYFVWCENELWPSHTERSWQRKDERKQGSLLPFLNTITKKGGLCPPTVTMLEMLVGIP